MLFSGACFFIQLVHHHRVKNPHDMTTDIRCHVVLSENSRPLETKRVNQEAWPKLPSEKQLVPF